MQPPPVTYPPLPHHIATRAAERPDHPAILDGERTLSYRQLEDQMRRGAETLRKLGVAHGDRVMVAAPTKLDLLAGVIAGMAAGAAVLPVSLAEEDIEPVARYFSPKLIVIDPRHSQAAKVVDTFATLPISEIASEGPGDLADLAMEDIGLVILTSGTTQGQRRGALLSHRALSGTAEYINERMDLDSSVRDLVTAPLEHGFGMGRARCALHIGGTVCLQSGLFAPRIVIDEAIRRECNMLSAAVSGITLMLGQDQAGLGMLADRLRWLEIGTGHLKPAHRRSLIERLPRTRCFLTYGLTEAIRSTFLELAANPAKIDSVGQPTRWVSLRIVDENNTVLPQGKEGRIQVNGVNKASGYFGYEEAWRRKQVGEWLDTGDLGVLDQDGFLSFIGRTDDMINVGGLKVAPEEVEAELMTLFDGLGFAIARIPDPAGIEGFVPGLFIETTGEQHITLAEVRSYLRGRLPEFKIPRAVYAVDEFPRTASTRKIRRAALTWIAAEQDAARIPKTTALFGAIGKGPRLNWPAFEGALEISRGALFRALSPGSRPRSNAAPFTDGNALAWMRAAAQKDDPELGALIVQARELLPAPANSVIATSLTLLECAIVQAVVLQTLADGGGVLLLPPQERSSSPKDLGLVHAHRARYAIIESARFPLIAATERHLRDSLAYPQFERLALVGDEPTSEALIQFQREFGFLPSHLSSRAGTWSIRGLKPRIDTRALQNTQAVWAVIRNAASEVFQVDPGTLSLDSTPDNTPGWNSLGFVNLVTAVEESFNCELAPRDIMNIRQLGDLVAVLVGQSAPATP